MMEKEEQRPSVKIGESRREKKPTLSDISATHKEKMILNFLEKLNKNSDPFNEAEKIGVPPISLVSFILKYSSKNKKMFDRYKNIIRKFFNKKEIDVTQKNTIFIKLAGNKENPMMIKELYKENLGNYLEVMIGIIREDFRKEKYINDKVLAGKFAKEFNNEERKLVLKFLKEKENELSREGKGGYDYILEIYKEKIVEDNLLELIEKIEKEIMHKKGLDKFNLEGSKIKEELKKIFTKIVNGKEINNSDFSYLRKELRGYGVDFKLIENYVNGIKNEIKEI